MVNYFDNNIKMTGSHLDQIKLHRTDTKLRYTVSDNSLLSMNNSKWGKIIKSVWRMLIVNKLNSISKKKSSHNDSRSVTRSGIILYYIKIRQW